MNAKITMSFLKPWQKSIFMKHILRLINYCKNIITSTQPTFSPWRFGLYQRPSSEEVCSIPLPVLATIVMRRGKKSVVRVAQRVGPLVPVQWLPSFFPNMYCLSASLIHLVLLSDSLSRIVEAGQLITWLSWDAWSVSGDLFCSDRLDAVSYTHLTLPTILRV